MQKILNRAVDVNKPKKNSDWIEKILYVIAVLSGLGLIMSIVGSIAVIVVATVFSSTLPSPSKLTNRQIQQSTKIYSKDGELLYSVYQDKNRTLVKLDQISPHVLEATLAAEDGDFYEHTGLDIFGIIRSVYETVVLRNKQGGSTLTQQIAKNALLSTDRTLTRKIKDMVLALQIERAYNKDEILQIYLNEVTYVGTAYGVEAAAKTVFNKSAKDLTLAEGALIAGLPQSPGSYNPFSNPERAKNRQKYVLKLMHENGWIGKDGKHKRISDDEYKQAIEEQLVFNTIKGTIRAPHFVFYVLDLLRERYGDDMVQNGGLNVTTSIDLKMQDEFQKYVLDEVEKDKKAYNVGNGSLVALDPKTRQVWAMIGSKDYFAKDIDGQFNVAISPNRQPGSSLKPFTYLTGFTKGYLASSVIYDVPTSFINPDDPTHKPYSPGNYGNWGFRGPIQVRYALANSVNVPAVKMLDLVGIPSMVKLARELGIVSLGYDPKVHWLALTLGGSSVKLLDLTNGFASLAAGGKYKDLHPILEVKDSNGKILEKVNDSGGKQVVDEKFVYILTTILSDNDARTPAFGPRSALYFPKDKVAVKTGTSNDLKDNWTVGFTPEIAVGVWVGNNDNKPMSQISSGVTGAAPIWNKAINYYLKDHPNKEFPRPEGIKDEYIGVQSGMVPYEDEEKRLEYFVEGSEPKAKSPIYQKIEVCDDGEKEERLYTVYKAEKPEWQEDVDNWVKEKYKGDEKALNRHTDPAKLKEDDEDLFDLENCDDNDDGND